MNPKLLIVENDEQIRTELKLALAREYEISLADDRPRALAIFNEQRPPVVLLDLGLPPHSGNPEEGLAALSEMLAEQRNAKIIIVSAPGEKEKALKAIGAGAYDFLSKPVDVEELRIVLKRTFHVAALEGDYRELQRHLHADTFEGIIGTSPRMQSVFSTIGKVATSDAPVLVLGESGTGKEMAALAIHRRSSRKNGPFVTINCSAIPATLLESELFGHEKGSSTGGNVQRKGRIETAAGGTLFLDDIGELPALLQVKLLRFLQEGTIERVGGRQEIRVDTRVVAATNVDLEKAIAEEKFREDLYYRLAVLVIKLPALRDRENDIQLLAQEFLRRLAAKSGKEGLAFGPDALREMLKHSWPGNIRELENRVKRAVIMTDGKRIGAADLELAAIAGDHIHTTLREARESLERELVLRALKRSGGKIAPAAIELGISRPTMYELMEKLGVQRPERDAKTCEAH
jgi:two-component system, NtrC family, response regulator